MVILRLFLCLCCCAYLQSAEETNDDPIIPVVFTGNDKLNSNQLRNAASRELERFATYQREADLFDASYSILQFMRDQGYYFARVNYAYVPDKSNPQKVLFTVTERQAAIIKDIKVTGAEAWKTWKDEDISLTIASPIKGMLKHFGVGDLIFRQKDVDNAINSITTAYVLHGYQRVMVGPAKLKWNSDKSTVSIKIPVVEGPQFTFSSLSIESDLSDSNINPKTLKASHKNIKLSGTPFHPRHLREQIGKSAAISMTPVTLLQ